VRRQQFPNPPLHGGIGGRLAVSDEEAAVLNRIVEELAAEIVRWSSSRRRRQERPSMTIKY